MLIPLTTDSPIKKTPYVNFGILGLNVAVHVAGAMSPDFLAFSGKHLVLNTEWPSLPQFFTYQFLHSHASVWHLAGNMLFLWVFGNSVNAKMGHLPYLLFYVATGIAAGVGFSLAGSGHLLGASGSIAGVTTAFLVLFPRSNIKILYWFFFIGTFELPSLIMIVVKIIVWDNIVGPTLMRGADSAVAYSAHLAGYGFGFGATITLLLIGAFPRDQFDLLSVMKRWRQRREFGAEMRDPKKRARGKYGRVARIEVVDEEKEGDPVRQAAKERAVSLRGEISRALSQQDRTRAVDLYEQLLMEDADQYLSRQAQLDVANQFYTLNRAPQAATAYERFLKHYSASSEAEHVRLLLGIIYARDLRHYETAEKYLRDSMEKLGEGRRREQCSHWLNVVLAAMGRPSPES